MITSSINTDTTYYLGFQKENEGHSYAKDVGRQELTEKEEKEVKELKKIDKEVRRHEQAHLAAAGDLARGGATFDYTRGPDGKRYATGGEVNIDISPIKGDPEATIKKMQKVRRAALAPADPSAQDRAVAARAAREEAKARAELNSGKITDDSSNRLSIYSQQYNKSSVSYYA